MATDTQAHPSLPAARFGRRSSRGVLFGMSLPRLATVAVAFVVGAGALVTAGPGGVVTTSPIWALALITAYVPVRGRTLVEWAPVVGHWWWRKALGQHRYRARPMKPRPAGMLALPGDMARLRVLVDEMTGSAMVHDPYEGTLTAVLKVSHGAFVLVDPATQAARADGWGRVLGGLTAGERGICRVQVLERALPDAGVDVAAWWAEHGTDDGSWMASAYTELLARATPASEKHETLLAITLSLKTASRSVREQGGGLRGATAVMRQRMASFEAAVRGAELHPAGWLTDAGLAWVLRTAYDPESARGLEGARAGGDAATAGPVAVDEEWARLRSDSGWHAALWVSEWPRLPVVPGFLWPLVLGPQVRRSLSIVAEPVPTAKALREVRAERFDHASDQVNRDKRGQITDYTSVAEVDDVAQREQELVSGHSDLRYAAFIAVSAPTEDALTVAVDEIINAAVESYCEVRVLWGEQGTGFAAAALPLGRGI
ncbi:MAG: SCO6880 family protein [bacterium]